jgi:hypothetical protein
LSEPQPLLATEEFARDLSRVVRQIKNLRGSGVRITDDAIEIIAATLAASSQGGPAGKRLIWVKITANETGGGKYQGKSYTHDGTTDVAATGNVAESELGTVSSTVDCRVLNYAEEGETTHDLTAGTPENDTFLCHWYRTNSDGIKVCAVVAFDRETCE